jgi:cytochrome b involved in lipid metabolism
MAKSKRDENNIPSEHSWRGYGPFYYNTFDILKKIPIKKSCQQIETYQNIFTLEEVAKHNTVNDLWTYYKDNVYNLTDWISKHPGGRVVIKAGGKDLEKVWKEMGVEWHMKNTRVLELLEKYKIGILEKKQIETFKNEPTVYDNLSKEKILFYLLNDRTFKNIKISLKDYPYLSYIYLKGILAKNRKEDYFKKLYLPFIKKHVSQDTYDFLVYFGSGPGVGIDINNMSYGHYTYVVEKQLQTNQSWQVMVKPTNEAWFDEWVDYLKTLGVKIYLNTSLKKINFEKNRITSCEIENGGKIKIIE